MCAARLANVRSGGGDSGMGGSGRGGGAGGFLRHVHVEHLLAGVSGGVTSTLILHPLDLIKIRFAGDYLSNLT